MRGVECPCFDGTLQEIEPDCGIPVDTVNGGCNSTPPVSIPVDCGDVVCGTGAFDTSVGSRDTDWYDITVGGPGQTDVTITCTAEFESIIGFIAFPCPQSAFLSFNTGAPCSTISLTRCLAPGTYYLFVAPQFLGGVNCSGPGNRYRFEIGCAPASCPPPANDECSGAIPVTCGSSNAFSNANATTAPDDIPASCARGGPQTGAGTVWFNFVATDVNASISTCASTEVDDTIVAVYAGTCGNLTEIGCGDDGCGSTGLNSIADVSNLAPGTTYYIRVSTYTGFGSPQGSFSLEVSCFGDCVQQQPGDLVEIEPDCGIPVDTVNGGCNSTPPVFTEINCGETFFATGGNDGSIGLRDTDWYRAVFGTPTQIIWSATADFPVRLFVITPQPDCSNLLLQGPFDAGRCNTATSGIISLPAGEHWFFVATQGFGGNPCLLEYRATLECVGDCNHNGIDDAQDIASGTSSDCNEDGVPDECCEQTLTLTAGLPDAFAAPNEPAVPGALLTDLLTCALGTRDFDDTSPDLCFGHTIDGLPHGIKRAQLTIRLRAASSSVTSNDTISLQARVPCGDSLTWGRFIGAGNPQPGLLATTWSANSDATIVLDLANLPNADGTTTNLIYRLNADRRLDIASQDDSGVDFAQLDLVYCPDCNANGVLDSCDIAAGLLHDVNHNGAPDECEDCVPRQSYGDDVAVRTGLHLWKRSLFAKRISLERTGDIIGKGEAFLTFDVSSCPDPAFSSPQFADCTQSKLFPDGGFKSGGKKFRRAKGRCDDTCADDSDDCRWLKLGEGSGLPVFADTVIDGNTPRFCDATINVGGEDLDRNAWDIILCILAIGAVTAGLTWLFLEIAAFLALVPNCSIKLVGSSRVDLQACKLEYSIVSPK